MQVNFMETELNKILLLIITPADKKAEYNRHILADTLSLTAVHSSHS